MAEVSWRQFLTPLGRVGAVITAGGALLPSAWAEGIILNGRPDRGMPPRTGTLSEAAAAKERDLVSSAARPTASLA